MAIDGWRSKFGEVEIVAIEGHADYADAVEEPGNLHRRRRSSCRVSDLLQETAIGISDVQRSIITGASGQSDGLYGYAFSAAGAVENSVLSQRSAGGAGRKDEPENA